MIQAANVFKWKPDKSCVHVRGAEDIHSASESLQARDGRKTLFSKNHCKNQD